MLLFIDLVNEYITAVCSFNTSHVTLYLGGINRSLNRPMFQYISCYSLSRHTDNQRGIRKHVSIHLMLLFISKKHDVEITVKGFNTSHVTLYQLSQSYCTHSSSVSIHLMLLFIPRFIGFSSSNSFYNTAKYKGLQDFYQPTYHFLFTHQNLI